MTQKSNWALTVGEGIREHEKERKKSLKLGGNWTHNLCIRSTWFRDKIHDLDYPPLSASDVVVPPAEVPEGRWFDSHQGKIHFSLPRVIPYSLLSGLTLSVLSGSLKCKLKCRAPRLQPPFPLPALVIRPLSFTNRQVFPMVCTLNDHRNDVIMLKTL